MNDVRVITNNVPRPVIYGYELTAQERADFDYIDWSAVDRLEDGGGEFVRYKGDLIHLGEFSVDWGLSRGTGLPEHLRGWQAYLSDSAFTALVVRYADDEHVVIGRVLS